MNKKLAYVLLFLVAFSASCQAYECFCEHMYWPCKSVQSLKCKGGLAWDECGCCKICAKVLGETCNGFWGLDGTCGTGLVCDTSGRAHWPMPQGRCDTGLVCDTSGRAHWRMPQGTCDTGLVCETSGRAHWPMPQGRCVDQNARTKK